MKSDENKTYDTAPLLPHSISNCQDYQGLDLSPIIVQSGQTPLSQMEDRSIDYCRILDSPNLYDN